MNNTVGEEGIYISRLEMVPVLRCGRSGFVNVGFVVKAPNDSHIVLLGAFTQKYEACENVV